MFDIPSITSSLTNEELELVRQYQEEFKSIHAEDAEETIRDLIRGMDAMEAFTELHLPIEEMELDEEALRDRRAIEELEAEGMNPYALEGLMANAVF